MVPLALVVLLGLLSLSSCRADSQGGPFPGVDYCGFSPFSVCFNDPEPLGCFHNGPNTPWCHQVFLPQDPNTIKPEFWFFTPEHPEPQPIDFFHLPATLAPLIFDTQRQLWVIIHGFGSTWPKPFVYPMKDALIERGNNVIIVRWTIGSAPPNYLQCVANTRVMGAVVARILNQMVSIRGLDLSRTNLVGFSLGAHVAGFAGARLPGLKRIVGLDPAGPDYGNGDPVETSPISRLNHTDAKFVQCIHTDGLYVFNGGCGTHEAWGHIDFFPNGGLIQPNCPLPQSVAFTDLLHFDFTKLFNDVACSHLRAPFLFISSIVNSASSSQCKYKAFPCDNADDWNSGRCFRCPPQGCPVAGYELDYGTPFSGRYYFATRANNDTAGHFCGAQHLLGLRPDVDVHGSLDITFLDSSDAASDTINFQTIDATLTSSHINQKVLVGTFGQPVAKIRVMYHRYIDQYFFWRDGVKTFNLNLVRLVDQEGFSKEASRNVEVIDGEEATIYI